MEDFPILNNLMDVAGSSRLHNRMGLWFGQGATEEGLLAKLIRAGIDHLKRMIIKRKELIVEKEALGPYGVALDCLDALRDTQARQTNQLAHLIELLGETDAAIRKQEAYVAKMAENNY